MVDVETVGSMVEAVVLERVRVGLEVRKVVRQVGKFLELDGGEWYGASTVVGVLGREVGSFRLTNVHHGVAWSGLVFFLFLLFMWKKGNEKQRQRKAEKTRTRKKDKEQNQVLNTCRELST